MGTDALLAARTPQIARTVLVVAIGLVASVAPIDARDARARTPAEIEIRRAEIAVLVATLLGTSVPRPAEGVALA